MNEIIKNMLTRVSVRKFTAERVEDEKLKTIVECAKASPTGKNRQMRKFTVVHNREKIQELAKAVSSVLDIPNYRIYDCDALILISFEEEDRFGYCDSSVAIENIYLAAHALGLGSVWINQLREKCNSPEIRRVLDSFNIPKKHVVCGISAIGYPAEHPEPKTRTEPVEFIN